MSNKNDIALKCDAQQALCKFHNLDNIAPTNGICWSCYKQIYDNISLEEASIKFVSGCPYCHKSFCS